MKRDMITFSPRNQFIFTCPVFDTDVKMALCIRLRDKVYAGQRLDVRRGCQACVASSKCPVSEMLRCFSFSHGRLYDDGHGSVEPKKGKLQIHLLERTVNVVVQDVHLRQYDVPPNERALIASSRPRFLEQMKTAPGTRTVSPDEFSDAPKSRKGETAKLAKRTKSRVNINHAAATGDMAAAINA